MEKIKTGIKWFFTSKLRIALASFMILLILCVSVFFYYESQLQPVSSNKEDVVYFSIVENDTIASISERLEEQGIIKDATMLSFYAKINKLNHLEIGNYELNKAWSAKAIIEYLNDGNNILNDQVLLTFREGIWAKDIAKILSENTNVSENELLTLWNDESFLKQLIAEYDFLDESILNSVYPVKLEGYLFPETYYFKIDTNPEEITRIFLNQFAKEYDEIYTDVAKSEYSLHEIVTLASVVQFESASVEDMRMIAGVFFNRLAINQKLESSVTVCYALYEYDSWEACEQRVDIDSPYNTYMYEGLPVGPILNPGKDAIEAVLNPTANEYYFFLADVHGDGKVYYSKTFEEHLEKQSQYLGY